MTNFEKLQIISSNELIRDKSVLDIAISCKEGIKILLKFDPTPHGDMALEFSNVKSFNLQGDREFDLNGILVSHYKLFYQNLKMYIFHLTHMEN